MKRIISFLLCAVMLFGIMPGLQANATEEVAAPVAETLAVETAPQETEAVETELPEEEAAVILTEPVETETPADALEVPAEETETVIQNFQIPTGVLEGSLIGQEEEFLSNQEMDHGYVESLFTADGQVPYGTTARNNLRYSNAKLYDKMKTKIVGIAANGGNSEFEYAVSTLGLTNMVVDGVYKSGGKWYITDEGAAQLSAMLIDSMKVICALLYDYPYELYWFDKTLGWSYGYSDDGLYVNNTTGAISMKGYFYIGLKVNKAYGSGFNTTKNMSSAKTAAANAKAIVKEYASKSDYQKLLAYKQRICSMVTYDYDAVENDSFQQNMNPWQLVYAFDNNPNTNIVCEGYSKAFQYLCDQSTFQDSSLYCISVDGQAGGPHMWNVVHIGGKNYTVDVTWCDDEYSSGGSEEMFLKAPLKGNYSNGYTYTYGYRYYSKDTLSAYTANQLKLSTTDYTPPAPAPAGSLPMYRLYNPYTLENLFTVGAEERTALIAAGWEDKGFVWYAATSGPLVYRMYNPYGDFHIYTMGEGEIETMVSSGWKLDGVATSSAGPDGIAITRLFNPKVNPEDNTCYHYYSVDRAEIDRMVSEGWIEEGIAWFAVRAN